MKKLSLLFVVLLFVGCEGPAGPRGPEGLPGPVGQAFEVEANFNPSNGYSQQFFFSDYGAEVLESDIVMVYWLYEGINENEIDVWQQLPASVFFDDGGEMQYSFDHTVDDVQLFLTGDINLDTLGPGYTKTQYFRVAILPVDYVKAKNINMSNMQEVMRAVDKRKIQRLHLN
ncbi:MAG TPA: collagen-like protein [Fodinibius sp.]|nr:collagen-like protein [Fodinibius sp.]